MAVVSQEDASSTSPSIQEWALATTKEWSKEVRREISREKHRARTARYRAKRQVKHEAMVQEYEQLQETLRHRLTEIEYKLAGDEEVPNSTANDVQRLTLERRILVSQNAELRKATLQQSKLQQVIEKECGYLLNQEDKTSPDEENEQNSIRDSRWIPAPSTSDRREDGWRVYFPNGEPSFFFHPFTRDEYDCLMKRCDDILAQNPPPIEVTGSLFGWTVHHAPLTRRTTDNSLVAHARFTRRVHCSLMDADKMLNKLDIDAWPLIVTPSTWGHDQIKRTHCQVLQEFDTDAYVLVRNIPGPTNIRYVNLARRLFRKQANGKPMATYATVIADSDANARNRAAEQPQFDVQWVHEGGTYIKFAQVDERTIDVTYDHWSSCYDDLHAQHLFIRWAQFAVRLQQWVLPTRLLTCA